MWEQLEEEISTILDKLKEKCEKVTTNALGSNNNLLAMVNSGSKGNSSNIYQMIGCVGKQEINNERIQFGFYKRTLPHYWKEDYSFVSRGFVLHSFLIGLTPQEFFFHSMAGRQGIIDTAIKTSVTGYIQHRLVKCMEDIQSKYDKTVRRPSGDLIELMYGQDGMDAARCESQNYPFCFKPDNKDKSEEEEEEEDLNTFDKHFMHNKYKWNLEDKSIERLVDASVLEQMKTNPEYKKLLEDEFDEILNERAELYKYERKTVDFKDESFVCVAVNFERQINNVISDNYLPRNEKTDLDPKYIIEKKKELLNKLEHNGVAGEDKIDLERNKDATGPFRKAFISYLSTKQIMLEYHLKKDAFDDLLKRIEDIYVRSYIQPGEMIGSISAQSIGAPATQMTLNTFHHAGISLKNVTEGVPRLQELLNVAKNPKTPTMKVHIKSDYLNDPNTVWTKEKIEEDRKRLEKELSEQLQFRAFREVVKSYQIWYDPDLKNSKIERDRKFIENFLEIEDIDLKKYCSWSVRIIISFEKLIALHITEPEHLKYCIVNKMKQYFEKREEKVLVIDDEFTNTTKDKTVIILLRFEKSCIDESVHEEDTHKTNIISKLKGYTKDLLNNLRIFGVEGISKVIVEKKPQEYTITDEDKYRKIEKQWVVLTEGSNLKEVAKLENVDFDRTVSNNIIEIYNLLGVEAGRLQLIAEFVKALSGSYVNFRHLELLADVISHMGRLHPITRIGLSKNNAGVITRASFEQTLYQFKKAAAFSESDLLNGVSQNILMGQRTIAGTGAFTVIIDIDELRKFSNDDGNNSPSEGKTFSLSPKIKKIFSPKRGENPTQSSSFTKTSNSSASPFIGASPFINRPSPFVNGGASPFINNRPSPFVNGGASPFINRSSPQVNGGASPFIINRSSPFVNGGTSPFINRSGSYSPQIRPSPSVENPKGDSKFGDAGVTNQNFSSHK